MWTRPSCRLPLGAVVALLLVLNACGGGGSGPSPVTTTLPPTPAATITATGESDLVLHPSADSRFFYALETPMRITETAGGTADWNFARISLFRGTVEERFELGSDIIRAAGFGRINPRSNQLVRVAFRFNDERFDRIVITLGFGDIKDGRQFTVQVSGGWNQVTISPIPLNVPFEGQVLPGRP